MTELAPSTADYLRFHALHRPDAIALIDNGRKIDYATFYRDLGKFTRALGRLELPRGSAVAVAWEGLYLHWLLLLACENLGIATTTFLPDERGTLGQLFAHVRLVLCGRELPEAAGKPCHVMTKEWVDGVFAMPDTDGDAASGWAPPGLDEPQRIDRSSGTTGAFKMMVTTRRFENIVLPRQGLFFRFTPESRLLLSTPFTVPSTRRRATGALRVGAACIQDTRIGLAQAIVEYLPTHVRLFQFQMRSLLDQLPKRFRKPANLMVMVGAAPLAESMRARLLERLASRIVYGFGANETGTIMLVGDDGLLTPCPDVQLGVVGEHGQSVPPGVEGAVRVRTAGMVSGYIDNPELTAQVFRDGWFHTGDTGVLLPSGRLKLMGRANETLNVGGVKISPAVIEELVAKTVPVEDVGVTSITNADGLEELCIAVVLPDTANRAECATRIGNGLPRQFGQVHVGVVRGIPRTDESGKIRRGELKKLFAPKKSP